MWAPRSRFGREHEKADDDHGGGAWFQQFSGAMPWRGVIPRALPERPCRSPVLTPEAADMTSLSKSNTNGSSPALPAWAPTVDLATARPVVFALARSVHTTEGQVRRAIAELRRLGDWPVDDDLDVTQRPWSWLRSVARTAAASGDDHLAAACLLWAFHWTTDLARRNGGESFAGVGLAPIRIDVKVDILAIGIASLTRLPVDFVIAGDGIDAVRAGRLLDQASHILDP
jgi:hypothetical protein